MLVKNNHDQNHTFQLREIQSAQWDREAKRPGWLRLALWICNWGSRMEVSWSLRIDEVLPWGSICWTDVGGQLFLQQVFPGCSLHAKGRDAEQHRR